MLDNAIHELLIIGAGPHALSVLSALLETRPDKYLEHPDNRLLFHRPRSEHNGLSCSGKVFARDQYYDVARRQHKGERQAVEGVLKNSSRPGAGSRIPEEAKAALKKAALQQALEKNGPRSDGEKTSLTAEELPAKWLRERLVVLDKYGMQGPAEDKHKLGAWMPLWRKQMDFLRVPHLRSPVSHHPDPMDRFMMWQYAITHKRGPCSNLIPLQITRDASFTGPFLLPSTDLFWEFCSKVVVHGFDLHGVVEQGDVVELVPIACACDVATEQFGNQESKFCDYFEVHLKCGRLLRARNVVLATGSSCADRKIPAWVQDLKESGSDHPKHCLAHCFDIAVDPEVYLPPLCNCEEQVAERSCKEISVSIIGGGITSIHLCRVALDLGCKNVNLIARSPLRIQPFDVNLEWFGPKRPSHMATFWSDRNPVGRAQRLKRARFPATTSDTDGSGSSITLEAIDLVQDGLDDGRIVVREAVEVMGAEWHWESHGKGKWELFLSDGSWVVTNAVWLATGTSPSADADPLLRKVFQQYPIRITKGLPSVQEDLSWSCTCPGLFVTGPLAALEVGPGAANLNGGRIAAGRIVPSLRKRLRKAYETGI